MKKKFNWLGLVIEIAKVTIAFLVGNNVNL